MADGTQQAISEVKIGQLVEATDPITGDTQAKPILAIFVHTGMRTAVTVTLADGSQITATDEHFFWDATTEKFVWAIKLAVGDDLLTPAGDIAIVSLGVHHMLFTAYNLAISGIHTYYAGSTPVLVHNSCGRPLTPKEFAAAVVRDTRNKYRGSATETGQHGSGLMKTAQDLRGQVKNNGYLDEVNAHITAAANRFEARARGINHAM